MLKTFIVYLLATLSMLQIEALPASETEDELKLGIFPRRNAIQTQRMFGTLVQHLSQSLGKKVKLVTPNNFNSFWKDVTSQKYDIVHYNQYHYVKSHKEFGYNVIAKNIEFNEETIAGSIIVRADGNINSVQDLKGKKIVFGGGPKAMQSYIVATYLLREAGLQKGDYIEAFATNPPNAILSTFYKQSDAAGAGDKVLKLNVVKNQIDTNKMKYLLRGQQLDHLPWAVKKDMPVNLAKQIQQILLNLSKTPKGRIALRKMRLDGFAVASDQDYDKHRLIIKKVLNENY